MKAGSGDIINRVRAEAANPKCDVIWSIGAELLEANTDLLEPYQPKEAAMIADAFKTNAAWLPYTGIVNVFVVNTKKLKPEEYPKTWLDLAQPRFKNLVSMADIEKSGSAYMQLNTFLTIYGDNEAGWSKFKTVFTEHGRIHQLRRRAPLRQRRRGRGWHDAGGQRLPLPQGRRAGRHRLSRGRHLGHRRRDGPGQACPNPAAGKAFIDWSLSAPVQQLVVQELGRRPIRKDAKPLAALKPMDQIKLVKYDIKRAAEKRKEYVTRWQELVQSR